MTTIYSTATSLQRLDADGAFDEAQLAAAAFLARYSGRTLDAYRHDLGGFFQWSADVGLTVLAATRRHIELYGGWMEGRGLAASTIEIRATSCDPNPSTRPWARWCECECSGSPATMPPVSTMVDVAPGRCDRARIVCPSSARRAASAPWTSGRRPSGSTGPGDPHLGLRPANPLTQRLVVDRQLR